MIPRALATVMGVVWLAMVCAAPAWAQDGAPREGTLAGKVSDAGTGAALDGVEVTATWPAPEGGAEPRREVQTSDADGEFFFGSLPAGRYALEFGRAGYRPARIAGFDVLPDQANRADQQLEALAEEAAAEVDADIEEFVVIASPTTEIMAASRMDADELLNTLSADEFAKFAASDVADALRFIPGVNVAEGQFAIIRGLEDRYSSTLYNFAPMPSPDPDSQSVQLDLFPSEIVGDLSVAKTFQPEMPSNSSAGSINILTHYYPEEFELKISSGSGFNGNAWDRFLEFNDGSPVGTETDGWNTVEREFGIAVGAPWELLGRGMRFKGVFARETDFETGEGFQESLEPVPFAAAPVARSGGLALGELGLSAGRFDLTQSTRTDDTIGYGAFGFDLDEQGDHTIDGSAFYTRSEDETVQLFENGYLPDFDYGPLLERQRNNDEIRSDNFTGSGTNSTWLTRVRANVEDAAQQGPLWFSNFQESASFKTERDLRAVQFNGNHRIEWLEGLHLTWAGNRAKTTQEEVSRGARIFYEPADLDPYDLDLPDRFPVTVDALGDGSFVAGRGIFYNTNDIQETQRFFRFDAEYERDLGEVVTTALNAGLWWEKAERNVGSEFLESASVDGRSDIAITGETTQDLGEVIFDELDPGSDGALFTGLRQTTNEASRKIKAVNVGAKATFWERLDLMGGYRFESLFIESLNDPFTGFDEFDGSPAIFPTKYLMFDRLDNPARSEVGRPPPPGTRYNDEILGTGAPADPETGLVDLPDAASIQALVNGEIDERLALPSAGIAYRPIEGLSLRGAYSRTEARPSFREMGYYVTVEPATDDLLIGNPQLQTSEVKSWDTRAEYVWGDFGELVAASFFYKTIGTPIESIVVRNPANVEGSSSALYRTFFNNPNEASLWGIEVEARKNLGFLGWGFLEYFSIGGNFTWIDAEVARTDIELARSEGFFGTVNGEAERFESLEPKRRLFNQPEWIANAEITFEQPDWGTRATLAWYAISNVLDAAGVATVAPSGEVTSFTLDRYIDSYNRLDLIVSQRVWQDLTLKFSVKNLTNSRREIVYDEEQTRGQIPERSYKIGRDFSLSLSYTF